MTLPRCTCACRWAAIVVVALVARTDALAAPLLLAGAVGNQPAAPGVNDRQVDGMTPLHWAVYLDDLERTKRLLQAGADATATNQFGVAPLSLACMNGHTEIVALLLGSKADPNTALPGGETVLLTAARSGRASAVKALLAAGAEVNARERRGQTALMWAAAEGHADVVELLLAAGAEFRTPLETGWTPLLFAVREGRAECVRTLLKAGADVNAPAQPRKSVAKGIKPGTAPLLLAVENGHFELAVELLKAGADPNDQRSGFTPLHTLSWVRKPNRGDGEDGDPAPAGSGNMTSLQFARKLVEHGANVNARLKTGKSGKAQLNRTGATPFLLAALTDDVPFMRVLVELGADPLLPNVDGATALMAAAGLGTMAPGEEAGTEEEALHAVELAIELGCDVNAVARNGETVMHGAAYKNVPRVVELLAARGAKVEIWNRTNRWGWTPLHIATGYRAGNFKPSPDTLAALHRVMRAAGVTPPEKVDRPPNAGPDY